MNTIKVFVKYISVGLFVGAVFLFFVENALKAQEVGHLYDTSSNLDRELYFEEGMYLREVLSVLEERFDIVFLYRTEVVENNKVQRAVSLPGSIKQALEVLSNDLNLEFSYLSPKTYGIYSISDLDTDNPNEDRVRGTVTDSDGEPIPGVNVMIMGTNIGTVTNAQGHYEIAYSGNVTLIFSFIGFQRKEINTRTLEGESVLDVVLSEQTLGMEELVVLGYSEVQSQHVASSVSIMDMDRVRSGPVGKMQEVFRGAIPGVTMMQGTNIPGGVPGTIQIRGISTLQNAEPLVIVDGMEQSLTDIDPNQVRNITVLKDAASTSMYGSRGANGVIIIETERGMSDRFKVDVHSWTAINSPIDLPNFVNDRDFMLLRNEARSFQGQSSLFSQAQIDSASAGYYPNTDWMDTIMQNQAYSHNTSANISGGGGVGTFSLMIGYNQEGGLNPYEGSDRFSTRFNTNINIADRFVLLADFYAHRLQVDRLYANTDGHGLYRAAWRMNPTQEIFYDSDMENHYRLHNNLNPLASINHGGIQNNLYDRSTINLRPIFHVSDSFHISGNVSYMINKSANKHERRNFRFHDSEGVPVQVWNNAVGASQGVSVSQFTARALANYETSLRQGQDRIYITTGTELMNHNYTDYREIAKASFFGKINYSFDDRFILEATGRADGSSKFAPGHRWGFFPSGALAWNMHNEGFMSGMIDRGLIDNLRLRVSYGLIGNENVDPYLWEEVVNNWGWTMRVPNPGFSWEKQRQGNIGIDLTLLDTRLNLTAEAYNKFSYDLIYANFSVPPLTGSHSLISAVNIGEVKNTGWELSANWSDNAGDFSYSFGGMIFDNKNEVLRAGYSASDTLNFTGNNDMIWYRGIPIDNYYGFQSNGYFQNQDEIDTHASLPNTVPGDIRYVDQNGDGVINDADRVYLGNPLPRYNYSINVNFWFRRWDFTAVGQGVGRRTARLHGQEGFPVYAGGSNDMGAPRQEYMDNRWTPDNPESRFPRVWTGTSPNTVLSDVWLSDASFFRIQTIELGYTIPSIGSNFRDVRIYFNAQDAFTFTNWEGLEPERDGGNGNYPRMARYSIGIRTTLY
ncbi:MAG: SusC/RagA family TonB-linked outer membrane protein [Balneolaceae bacterium]|nr:SusC/RagA family TonB-linked outer membrane protein [Balneolaceae bacterium]